MQICSFGSKLLSSRRYFRKLSNTYSFASFWDRSAKLWPKHQNMSNRVHLPERPSSAPPRASDIQQLSWAETTAPRVPQPADWVFDEFLRFPKEETCPFKLFRILNTLGDLETYKYTFEGQFSEGIHSVLFKEALGGERRRISWKLPRTIVYV